MSAVINYSIMAITVEEVTTTDKNIILYQELKYYQPTDVKYACCSEFLSAKLANTIGIYEYVNIHSTGCC